MVQGYTNRLPGASPNGERGTALSEICEVQGMHLHEHILGYADQCHRGRIVYPAYPLATWLAEDRPSDSASASAKMPKVTEELAEDLKLKFQLII